MQCEKIAFKMYLNPGAFDEYRRRHDALWPELQDLLKRFGIADYSIYCDLATHTLFATQVRPVGFDSASLADDPVMRRWWAHMADIMRTNADGAPVVEALPCVFHLP